jgi:hypothetical protein
LELTTLNEIVNLLNFSNLSNLCDSLGEEALFTFEKDSFSVTLVLIVPENLGARRVEDIPGPGPGTVHALGVIDRVEKVRLDTLPAHIKITERANGLFMIYFVELFTTNIAFGSHLILYY